MAYTKTEQGQDGYTITQAATYLGMTYFAFNDRRRSGEIGPPTTSQGGSRKYYTAAQLDKIKEQFETARAKRVEQRKNVYDNTQAAQYLGLSYNVFQNRLNQCVIEPPQQNIGGVRNFYTKEQLDRIKQQLTNNGGK